MCFIEAYKPISQLSCQSFLPLHCARTKEKWYPGLYELFVNQTAKLKFSPITLTRFLFSLPGLLSLWPSDSFSCSNRLAEALFFWLKLSNLNRQSKQRINQILFKKWTTFPVYFLNLISQSCLKKLLSVWKASNSESLFLSRF